jgi:hypothetical protein
MLATPGERKNTTMKNNIVVSHNAIEAGLRRKPTRTNSNLLHDVVGKIKVFERISMPLLMKVPIAMRTSIEHSRNKNSER